MCDCSLPQYCGKCIYAIIVMLLLKNARTLTEKNMVYSQLFRRSIECMIAFSGYSSVITVFSLEEEALAEIMLAMLQAEISKTAKPEPPILKTPILETATPETPILEPSILETAKPEEQKSEALEYVICTRTRSN